jgi:hypothetical protein
MPDSFSTAEKRSEIERELAIRERLYPEWIRSGRLSADRARRQIDILRAIVRDYSEGDSNA